MTKPAEQSKDAADPDDAAARAEAAVEAVTDKLAAVTVTPAND
ncbi:MAG: hypothetical protein ABJC79_13470 [Acidimicrobiia bacterium]